LLGAVAVGAVGDNSCPGSYPLLGPKDQ